MGFFKSLKGDHPSAVGGNNPNSYAPPPGPPPSYESKQQQEQKEYAPPYGPPHLFQAENNRGQSGYAPPQGPPANHERYSPPPGAPPSHNVSGLTPSDGEPPPYHDWTVIPDNALLPPPPSFGNDRSPSSNANLSDADRAHDWCKAHPMMKPHQPTIAQHTAVVNGDVRVMKPSEYNGDLLMPNTGFWKGSTRFGSKDSCLLTSSPLYFAAADSPTQTTKTIYYELKLRSLGRGRGADESSIAVGYCAMPYPTWRMPGWERGSLAVHGDDGRRYVNDTWGGKDFTLPFQFGDTVGLGMSFSTPKNPPEYGAPPQAGTSIKVEIFFTRNGQKSEGWNLHEELDADNNLGVDGLDGRFDLYGAVGTFGGVEFDLIFNKRDWLWQPQ